MKKVFIFLLIFSVLQFVYAKPENEKTESENESALINKEAKEKVARVTEIEMSLEKINKDAIKEKDVKWKVCIDDYLGTFKGVALGAIKAGSKISELILAAKIDEAKNQLILLRGLAESAEKTLTESQSCERQLTSVNSQSTTIKEVNQNITGTVGSESVNDSMGVGFGSEFVADTDKSIISGSDLADAGGVDSSDVVVESPGASGENTESENESMGIIDTPEVIDVSPTK